MRIEARAAGFAWVTRDAEDAAWAIYAAHEAAAEAAHLAYEAAAAVGDMDEAAVAIACMLAARKEADTALDAYEGLNRHIVAPTP